MNKKAFAARTLTVSAFALVVSLAACSQDDDRRLSDDLAPPARTELMAPPVAPDVSQMHPALQLAKTRGLKTNVYFNEELQQNIARLQGMEETLGRLQNDLQGTAMAMQRVEMMRQEIEAMNVRMQSLQERLMYAGPMLAPAPAEMPADAPMGMVHSETVTTQQPIVDHGVRPTPLMGDLAAPDQPVTAQIAKPVMDEKPAAKPAASAPAATGNGVSDVRIGVHEGKVRIVLDIGGDKIANTVSLDTAEKLLTVELPETAWNGAKTETLKGNPLIASYTADASGKGSVVVFALKADTRILEQKTLKGTGGAASRVVIDLSR